METSIPFLSLQIAWRGYLELAGASSLQAPLGNTQEGWRENRFVQRSLRLISCFSYLWRCISQTNSSNMVLFHLLNLIVLVWMVNELNGGGNNDRKV